MLHDLCQCRPIDALSHCQSVLDLYIDVGPIYASVMCSVYIFLLLESREPTAV